MPNLEEPPVLGGGGHTWHVVQCVFTAKKCSATPTLCEYTVHKELDPLHPPSLKGYLAFLFAPSSPPRYHNMTTLLKWILGYSFPVESR